MESLKLMPKDSHEPEDEDFPLAEPNTPQRLRREEIIPIKLEDDAEAQGEVAVDISVIKSESIEQNDDSGGENGEPFEEPKPESIVEDEVTIKDEIEFGEYELNCLGNDSTNDDYVNEQCDESYHLQTNLDIPKAKTHGVGEAPQKNNKPAKHTCKHCKKPFTSFAALVYHRKSSHAEPFDKSQCVRCQSCRKMFFTEEEMEEHVCHKQIILKRTTVHGVGEASPEEVRLVKYTCKHCKKQFTSWGVLVYHRKSRHGESIDKSQFVQCPSCFLKFAAKEEMDGHICLEGIVCVRDRPFKCDLCDETYFTKKKLDCHYSVHPEYHNLKCDQCPEGFFNEKELNNHKKAHITQKFECEICNQLFKNQKCLKQHQELHSDREYCCEHCGKKFKRRINLDYHTHRVHPEYVSDAARAARAIPCTICGKTLKGERSLKFHMQVHSNDRRFTCSFPSCGKTFITNSCLKVHEQSHTKDYKFRCQFCAYGAVARRAILLHEQREHNHNRLAEVNDS